MRKKSWWKSVLAGLLSFVMIFTGIPLVPGTSVKEAKAAIPLRVNPATISAIYGGEANNTFRFVGDPYNEELTSHFTTIKIRGENIAETVLHTATYPIEQDITYVWNGKINGQPARDGTYTIIVEPAPPYDGYAKFFNVEVYNPLPPAPIMEIAHFEINGEKDLYNNKHIIRGIAEKDTQVFLTIKTYTRIDDQTRVEEGPEEIWVSNIPVVYPRQSDWAFNWSVNSYFEKVPLRDDNKPEQYVGEWQVEVELPEYKIAEIKAYTFRPFEEKTSSKKTALPELLRYKSPDWGIKWAVVASYYYDKITVEEIREKIEAIGKFVTVGI